MLDIGEIQPDTLIKQNDDMLKHCTLFELGGNYSVEEIEWYRDQMNDIDKLIEESKTKRNENIA